MLFGCWTLLAVLAGALLARSEPQDIEILKRRILASMGMESVPDMRLVNTSEIVMKTMMEKYLQRVKRSERELLSFEPRG
ncbi:hypothetical protein CEXT_280091 [Caerostris extrusa]|uniref:Uncharacterized protein n=1 Tax=Caerostris extrusa TaxID=172846 RepID=A0AAV4MH41_CAEEX|nr:hypothetical protein CEXT_280091 [Caerostris extrusa]